MKPLFATLQEAFDATVLHLAVQGQRAYVPGWGCVYRMKDDLKCAIGFHIPDGHEAQDSSGSVYKMFDKHPDIQELMSPFGMHSWKVREFWADMQRTHDTSGTLTLLKCRLFDVANKHNLEWESIENIRQWS